MKKHFLLFLILSMVTVLVVSEAHAVRVTIKRIIFEGPKRAEVMTIINNSDVAETYRISWRNYMMNTEGRVRPVPEGTFPEGLKPVDDMIKFAPRRFTIPAGQSQQIRFILRTPAGLEDGEYRSHLWIRPEAKVDDVNVEQKKQNSGQTTGVSMKILGGVTSPVIVRKGSLSATMSIDGLQVSQTPGFVDVSFNLNRAGNKSVYGALNYICNEGTPDKYVLRTTKGIGVYTEITTRQFRNKQFEKPQDKPTCSSMTVEYVEAKKFAEVGTNVLASATAPVR